MWHEVKMQELQVDFIFQECADTAEVFCSTLALQPGNTGWFSIESRSVWPNVQYLKAGSYYLKKDAQTCFTPGVSQSLYSFSSTDVGYLGGYQNSNTIKTLDMFIPAPILAI